MEVIPHIKERFPVTAAVCEQLGNAVISCREAGITTDLPVKHSFTPGMYIRELFVPKHHFIITKLHKTEHPYVISKGKIRVWTEEKGVVELSAPFTGITKPGVIRVAFTLEDTVWTTFHATTETDITKLEEELAVDPAEFATRTVTTTGATAIDL